ncbi:hypothetical protein RB195_013710 [Necator americanus]|uniref:Stress-response A/B barrel domain-containing protein n=1 Tax=Necator americanus TaxID=51031 RepID=A0ABR1DXG2_NECAM
MTLNTVDVTKAAEPPTESSLFLRVCFIQRLRCEHEDDFGEYSVQHAHQAYRAVVSKVPSVTSLTDNLLSEDKKSCAPIELHEVDAPQADENLRT